jgi:hypothetical protein
VLFALFGIIAGRRMRAIRRYAAREEFNSPAWSALTGSAILNVSLCTRIWIVIGTVLLMVAQPGLRESLLIVVSSLVLGLLFSFISFGRNAAASTVKIASR